MKICLFVILLVLWGNLLHPLIGSTAVLPGGSWHFVLAGAALVAVSLVAARVLGLEAAALGLRRTGAFRVVLIGAFGGGFVAAAAVAITRYVAPTVIGQPVVYEPLSRIAAGDLTPHIAFFLPLGAVIPEEIAFRGTLLGGLLARYGVRAAVTGSAIAFALWHGTVAFFTVMNTTMPVVLIIPGIAGAFVVLFVGGLILAGLRVSTGSVLTGMAAHWIFNVVILIGLSTDRV
jgi:membrane protease YdiL (CAAX protease family)